MNRVHISPLSAALPVALCLLLAACGNKGDLFMPPPEPAVVDDADQAAPEPEPTGQDDADAQPPPPDPTTDPILDPAIEIRSDDDETLPATESPVTPLPPPPDDEDEGEGGDEGP